MATRLQGQVDEVVGVMKDNVAKVIDRGDRLEDLQDKSGTRHMDRLLNAFKSLFNHSEEGVRSNICISIVNFCFF